MKTLWFRQKRYGWGWVPSTWQGWLITLLYISILLLLSFSINDNSSPYDIVVMFVLPAIFLTVLFILIACKKGEKPEWRWGDKHDHHIHKK
jgi:uncharacterized membrane protein YhaH (DUF805 family)